MVWPFLVLGGLTVVLFALSLATGPRGAPGAAVPDLRHDPELLRLILVQIRLPRALLGVMVGATLGLSGAVLQGFLRNPLAEPGLLGASSSAALGAVIALYFGLSALFPAALPLAGIAGSALGLMLVILLARGSGSILTLILAGVAVNALAGALTALALNLAPSPYAAMEIVFWLLGSLADRSLEDVGIATPFMLAGWFLLLRLGRGLDALSLGEETARSLGFDIPRLRLEMVLGVGLSVGAAVAVAGSIGFVGLVVPHLLRPLVGHRPGLLLPASALGGAALTLAADLAVRWFSAGQELKLGVVTALVGAPFFLYLLVRMRRVGPA